MKLGWLGMEDPPPLRRKVPAMERAGYDTFLAVELAHDPFLRAALMAEHTTRAEIMTSIVVAFARNPMAIAMSAHDMHVLSGGRFVLGLGTQVKAHITRRFSMPWSRPAARMREMIAAILAIWDSWHQGTRLDFQGDFYTHTLMTPAFAPKDLQYGRPKIHLGAVGPQMTEVAGEIADGLICHPFTTVSYLKEVTLPSLQATLARRVNPAGFEVSLGPLVAIGDSEEALHGAVQQAKGQVAFYGSTPAYRPVLDRHGWGALHDELLGLSRQGRWSEMAALIDDRVLEAFVVMGAPRQVAAELGRRYGGLIDRLSVTFPVPDEQVPDLLALVRREAASSPLTAG